MNCDVIGMLGGNKQARTRRAFGDSQGESFMKFVYELGSFCLGALGAVNKVHDHAEYDARY